jgi:hypothetical protein
MRVAAVLTSKSFQSARGRKKCFSRYNSFMFAAHLISLTTASASQAGSAARASISKTTTIKG